MGIRATVKMIFLSFVTVAFRFCLVLRPILFHFDILIPLNSDDFYLCRDFSGNGRNLNSLFVVLLKE